MKTFFLNKLKQGLFLLLAVLGTFVSYAQPTQNLITTIDTGGNKTLDPGYIIKPKTTSLPGICYMAEVPENEPTSLFYIAETGGKGTSSDTGQVISPNDLDNIDTGGSKGTNTNTGDYATIGERSSISDTGGKNSSGGLEQSDTGGGNKGKSTTGEFTICDTGGKGNELGGQGIINTACMIYIPK
ncbi:hypothetical protein [Flavobacterium sp.]|uniref:hypothetical protein n=1 Tax=Flavobacterium sp. TaxID=239 RepID=UPI00286E730E|nr:hypothetical protein [Flavobacterium sp.]